MAAVEQLDLFSVSSGPAERDVPGCTSEPAVACHTLDDGSLLAAIPNACIRESVALVTEAGRRRSAAAIPVLEALCRRFAGFGGGRIVPEQAAALNALVMIGGSDAAQTLVRLIAKRIVQGPCLQQAVAVAARMGAKLPFDTVVELLRHDNPQVRADASRCTRAWPEAVPCCATSSMTCMRRSEGQPLALSGAWAGPRFAHFSSAICARNRAWNSSMRSLR